MPKRKLLFTFILSSNAKILQTLNNSDEENPYISIYATNYDKAVEKILKLKMPNIENSEDLQWLSVVEEETDDEINEKQSIE